MDFNGMEPLSRRAYKLISHTTLISLNEWGITSSDMCLKACSHQEKMERQEMHLDQTPHEVVLFLSIRNPVCLFIPALSGEHTPKTQEAKKPTFEKAGFFVTHS
jgi:hypothetical protein